MADNLLEIADLWQLDRLYLEATRRIDEIRRERLGAYIQKPKLPAALTEGLAALAAPSIFGARATRPSQGRSDLALDGSDGSTGHLIAVKGTAAARWVTITQTDLEASALVWIDYSDRAADGVAPVNLWIFDAALRTWATAGRATLRQAMSACGGQIRVATMRLVDTPHAAKVSVCRSLTLGGQPC
jgi:hypothetical protein